MSNIRCLVSFASVARSAFQKKHVVKRHSRLQRKTGHASFKLLWKGHTRHPVQDLRQGGGDGEVQRAVLVAGAVHGMLDEVTGRVDASFVQLHSQDSVRFRKRQ